LTCQSSCIDFSTAAAVFDGPLSLTRPDLFSDEIRLQTIGAALNGILFVVHTIREESGSDELVRIISARYATSTERKAYEILAARRGTLGWFRETMTKKTGVVRSATKGNSLCGSNRLGPNELGLMAKRLASASDATEIRRVRALLTRGFYGV
jgi:uncharacterized DUF497 family protein